MTTPMGAMIDQAVRCVACGAKLGGCDCWDIDAYGLALKQFAHVADSTSDVRAATAWLRRSKRARKRKPGPRLP